MNSAMPRLSVFVAVTNRFTWGFSRKATRHTFVCPFLELLVGGSLLYQIKDLNIMWLGKVSLPLQAEGWTFAPDCSGRQVLEARLFLG